MAGFVEQVRNIPTIVKISIVALIFILYIVMSSITGFSGLFGWWNANNGAKYGQNFSLLAIVMGYRNILMFYIINLFGNIYSQMNRDCISFIADMCFTRARLPNTPSTTNFVVPRHVTTSVTFSLEDNDPTFNTWNQRQIGIYKDQWSPLNPYVFSSGKVQPPYGPYPDPTDHDSWRAKLAQWTYNDPTVNWCTKSKDPSWCTAWKDTDDPSDVIQRWFDVSINGDNFLARYGIRPDCPLVEAFYNNAFDTKGIIVDPQAFRDMLASSTTKPGGWLGYAQGTGTSPAYNSMMNALYTTMKPATYTQTSQACQGSQLAGNIMGSVAAGASLGIMAIPEMGPFAVIPFLIGAATSALTSGLTSCL
jgi:hypothetical protein